MSSLSNDELQEILDDDKPDDIHRASIHAMAKELLYRRDEAEKNDTYIESLEKRLEPCTCQSGRCLQHDD